MNQRVQTGYVVGVLLLLCCPIIVVAGVSLNGQQSLLFPPQDVSLRWYAAFLRDPDWLVPLRNSVVIATAASTLAVLMALPLALHVWARQGWMSRALYTLGVAPFMLPPVISALGFLVFWISVGMYGEMAATIVSHGVFLITLPLVTLSLGLAAIDLSLIEAARTMGATRRIVFRTILLPLLTPYLISGFAFAFVLSLNEYVIAYMVAGFTVETLPIKIFNSLRYGYTPIMGVVSLLFVVIAAVIFGLIGRFGDLPRLMGAERAKE